MCVFEAADQWVRSHAACCADQYGVCVGVDSWLIERRDSTPANLSCYHLKGFTLDDSQGKLSTVTFQSFFWRLGLQQLTLTNSSVSEAGKLGCSSVACNQCLARTHKVGQCRR